MNGILGVTRYFKGVTRKSQKKFNQEKNIFSLKKTCHFH